MRFCFIILSVSFIYSCTTDHRTDRLNPSISTKLVRFEKELMQLDTADISLAYQDLYSRFPIFTDLYFDRVMAFPRDLNSRFEEIKMMYRDSIFSKLYLTTAEEFSNMDGIKKELDQTVENYMQVFPEVKAVPNFYTFISSFAYQCFLFNDLNNEGIGIGLDMFLGDDFPYHLIDPKNPAFSSYLSRAFNKAHLAKKVAEVLVEDKLLPPVKSDFLSLMIWSGKKLYLMDQILDFKPDSVVIEYTKDQLAWCKNNEAGIWEYFFDNDLFYETDINKFNKLISPSPFSPGMPEEAPGRTGNYMGWRIVDQFMKKNPDISIQQLIQIQDPQEILTRSKFKPSR